MVVSIRDGVRSDGVALQRIFRSASLSNADDEPTLREHPEALVLSGAALGAGRVRVAIDADGLAVGFATSVPGAKAIELVDLFVDPSRMRSGIGRALVIDLVRFAETFHAKRIEVTSNLQARAFYEKLGFIRDGEAATGFGTADRMHLELETAQDSTDRG